MVQQLFAETLEGGPRPLQFIINELPMSGSRRNVIYSSTVRPGEVIGQFTVDEEPVATADAGNTGDGTFTLAEPAVGPGLKAGTYVVEISGGSFAVAEPQFVGTGDGTLTLATPAFGIAVEPGIYQLVCIEPGATGVFQIYSPDGNPVGTATVGTPYDGSTLKFTIADGNADFIAGDTFTITVTETVPANGLAAFTVTDPQGVVLDPGVVGTPYDGVLKFTIADGQANFVVGDKWNVVVAVGDNTFGPWNPDETDGRQTVAGIACYGHTLAGGARADGVALTNDAQVKVDLLVAPTAPGAKAAAIAALWSSCRIRVR